jgi:hypothetical protein
VGAKHSKHTLQPFFPKLSKTGQKYIQDWLIMSISIKSLLDDKDESMRCYGIFLPYPTRWTLLMQDIALVLFSVLAIMMLSLFVMWLIVIVLLTVLLPIYLFGVLQPTIRKIALRLRSDFPQSKSIAHKRPIIIGRKEEGYETSKDSEHLGLAQTGQI